MRAKLDPGFSAYLMRIGNGIEPTLVGNKIKIPNSFLLQCQQKSSLDVLFKAVYPDMNNFINDPYSFMTRALLTSKNEFVDDINATLIDKFPGITTMVRKLLISDVSPGEKDWSCKGYKVQAMTYANEIDIFDNKLSLNATYIITDAIVSIPRGNLVLPDERYNCLWTLTRKCTVAVVPDEDKLEVVEDPEIDEISFSHFHKYINTMKKISVMAIVIHKLPRKHVDSKNGKIDAADFVLVDKQALSNSVTLHSLILTNAFNDAYLKLADLSSEQFVTIADVKSSIIEGKRYCIYASIQIPTKVKKFYYIACDGCWKGTIHNLGEEFECSYCGNSMAIAKPRCMMTIELTENNDFLESVLFGNIVEELLSVSASKLVDMDKKNETIDMQNVKEKLDNKTFKVELLCKKQNFRGTEQVRYSIISLQEQKKIAHAKRVKRKLIYDDTDDNTSDEHSKAFGDFDNEVTDKKSKLVKLG
nr:replication protein A 70 kDa DNA-binding subunit B-like isoform X1 [Ipomoea batatas]